MVQNQPAMPVRIAGRRPGVELVTDSDRVRAVVELAAALIRIPSVTNCPDERIDEVVACGRMIAGWLRDAGLEVEVYEHGRYPAVVAGFPGGLLSPITLSGHFDVVAPEPDDRQFDPFVDGNYLWGRGAADMKTVVASNMVWMRERIETGPPYPPVNALLVGNEENGEGQPFGTPQVLTDLADRHGWQPEIMLVGERTGETGNERFGMVCTENRGVARLRFTARGRRGHTGTGAVPGDLLNRLVELKGVLTSVFPRHLTLSSVDGWESAARFPFLNVGEAGVYNITPGSGCLGLEVRPIPSDDLDGMVNEITSLCRELAIEVDIEVMEGGVACPMENPHLARLIASVESVSGRPAALGRKKPGSSARFAPGGNAVVWGQSGVGPHAKDERHFIPSIEPYLEVLDEFARRSG
jgi:succinyl-diaminopimelate desuccinylase